MQTMKWFGVFGFVFNISSNFDLAFEMIFRHAENGRRVLSSHPLSVTTLVLNT